jgi:hypothetical protein
MCRANSNQINPLLATVPEVCPKISRGFHPHNFWHHARGKGQSLPRKFARFRRNCCATEIWEGPEGQGGERSSLRGVSDAALAALSGGRLIRRWARGDAVDFGFGALGNWRRVSNLKNIVIRTQVGRRNGLAIVGVISIGNFRIQVRPRRQRGPRYDEAARVGGAALACFQSRGFPYDEAFLVVPMDRTSVKAGLLRDGIKPGFLVEQFVDDARGFGGLADAALHARRITLFRNSFSSQLPVRSHPAVTDWRAGFCEIPNRITYPRVNISARLDHVTD